MSTYHILIIIGFVIMVINFICCVYYFYVRKDVSLPNNAPQILATDAAVIITYLLCIICFVLMRIDPTAEWAGWLVLLFSIFYWFILLWIFNFMDGMKDHNMEVLETLVSVLEAGDPNLDGHSLHVHYITMLLYDYIPRRIRRKINRNNLKYASLLFDVGKYGVPGRILNKTGKLKNEEWELMKKHPEICVRIFENIGNFKDISDWIRYHHERIDGGGYYALKGDEIPLASRMIALADTYSSITMTRAYKPTLTYEDAIAELKLVAGTQLDTELVDIFCNIPMNKVEGCMESVRNKLKSFGDAALLEKL